MVINDPHGLLYHPPFVWQITKNSTCILIIIGGNIIWPNDLKGMAAAAMIGTGTG